MLNLARAVVEQLRSPAGASPSGCPPKDGKPKGVLAKPAGVLPSIESDLAVFPSVDGCASAAGATGSRLTRPHDASLPTASKIAEGG